MTAHSETFELGKQQITITTGEIGRQANTIIAECDGTVVLVAATASKDALPNASFLPLSVDYQEKNYAGGRIPGGFFKREGRPSEHEILTSRLIDRSIRPLFPDFFYHETQIIATVMSSNPEVPADILAMIGAAGALAISGIPFNGPIGATRVAVHEENVVINPTYPEIEEGKLNLVVAGTKKGILMVESEAQQLSEEMMLDAIRQGHAAFQPMIAAIESLVAKAGKAPWDWQQPQLSDATKSIIKKLGEQQFADAYQIQSKQERSGALSTIRNAIMEAIATEAPEEAGETNLINSEIKKIESHIVRSQIIQGKPRIDGRAPDTVRPISIRLGVLPRTHGSALFTRGETQALVVTTLGSVKDAQRIDALNGEYTDDFMVHYNMPPYATGETGRAGIPKRREIGHGRLFKRALLAVMPPSEEFGYTIRLVSEITESNGSSSMASACGASLSMMDAGVPIRAHVSGIAMGLIKEGDDFVVLSDILGDEDHLGDMDFKVAGTRDGVTALQMDIKIDSITPEIMQQALAQANRGRLHILEIMEQAINQPRESVSQFAPRIIKMNIPVDKIRDVIGKGGSVIRGLTESTGASIDIDDTGLVTISGASLAICEKAEEKIIAVTSSFEIGKIYEGTVDKIITGVGAVISISPGKDGLLHISQISRQRINKVEDVLSVGENVRVKVVEAEPNRIRFTMKDLAE